MWWSRCKERLSTDRVYADPLQPEASLARWILEHLSSSRVRSHERCRQKKWRRWMFSGGCLYFTCAYCMVIYKSNKIHRYSVNTYYVQKHLLGANQYQFYSKPCQWRAVWFRASPLILVCLISPTCKVGVTVVSTYLPHRGVVRIHVVAFGALNFSEEVWHKHILFFNVLHACEDWRAEEFHMQATAATAERMKHTPRHSEDSVSSLFAVLLE